MHRLILFSLFTLVNVMMGQNSSQNITLFEISRPELRSDEHDWGNELYLSFQITADPILNGCELTTSLWYFGQQVRPHLISLESRAGKKIEVIRRWGPLNQPYEYVLAGQYKLEVSFVLENQPSQLIPKIKKFLDGKQVNKCEEAVYWKTPEIFQEEDAILRNFYAERIQNVNKLYRELKKESQRAFAKDEKSWRDWRYDFNQKLQAEIESQNKFHKVIFCYPYPMARVNLQEYYNLLERLSKILSIQIDKKYGREADASDKAIDSFGITRVDMIENNLDRLLKDIAKEMKLDLKKLLK